jgi:phage FluMu protein Com
MKPAEAVGEAFQSPLIENDSQSRFQCAPQTAEPGVAADDSLRCVCGALLARWVAAGLELKCRRCKRTTLIPYPKRTAIARRAPT